MQILSTHSRPALYNVTCSALWRGKASDSAWLESPSGRAEKRFWFYTVLALSLPTTQHRIKGGRGERGRRCERADWNWLPCARRPTPCIEDRLCLGACVALPLGVVCVDSSRMSQRYEWTLWTNAWLPRLTIASPFKRKGTCKGITTRSTEGN